jgi:histone-lysine N-methyltransferase MLL3
VTFHDTSAKRLWMRVFERIEPLRNASRQQSSAAPLLRLFPALLSGEEMFGLAEPAFLRVLESMPGLENLKDYTFKFGKSPLIELPLAVNPTGCARTEPHLRTFVRRPHTLNTSSPTGVSASVGSRSHGASPTLPLSNGDTSNGDTGLSKQLMYSRTQQYRRLRSESRQNVYLAKSRIAGLGVFAKRDLEKHTMVVEYIGQLIRNEMAEKRERYYQSQNRGIYMFRLDENTVIDATMAGNLARYINHSCAPNCFAERFEIEREFKIVIVTNRRITRGEELCYDYKFDFEDDTHKIPCSCGATNCRKWMN